MSAGWVIFLNSSRQSEGSLLNQIQKIKTFALITLGKIDYQTQIGSDHLILGTFATTNHRFFFNAVFTGWPSSTSKLAAFSDTNHRLNLSPQHQFLLWCKKLMTTNFTEESTQGTHHLQDDAELNLEPMSFLLAGVIKTAELTFAP